MSTIGYEAGRVRSADGTTIGYRRYGDGPGVILLHGGMKAAQHLSKLAAALSSGATVYVPDRRGRGMSGPHGSTFTVEREVEDLQALIAATGARFAFGHSSGALVTLRAAMCTPELDRIALFEPPLSVGGSVPMHWVARFDREIAADRRVAALVTALTGTRQEPTLARLPRFVLEPFLAAGLRLQRRVADDEVAIVDLIPTQHFDMRIVAELADSAGEYARLATGVLLLGGTRSPRYLDTALAELAAALPHVQRVTIEGAAHEAPEDDGRPVAVARILSDFFTGTRIGPSR